MDDDKLYNGPEETPEDEEQGMFEHFRLNIDVGQTPMRIDKYMATHLEDTSRHRVQCAIKQGYVFLNDKLALYQLNLLKEAGYVKDDVNVSEIEAGLIYRALIDWKLQIKQYNDLTHSQASAGGIETSQIDPKDMHIIDRRELYAVGETTDVLGKCGGYNISYALYTGFLAGRACLGGSL